jgi:energy-coupling factor transporter ATP-binding protein EcfA2
MNRAAQIASIINQRQPLALRIEKVEKNLRSLSAQLDRLQNHRNQLLSQVEDSSVSGDLKEIDCSFINRSIESELLALNQLKSRFSRNTLNIGVVGRAGQGKSRLLQSLSGLTTSEIPTGDRQHCTGVRSTIYHNPSVDTYGEVWFHTERSFLQEIIAPYYDKLYLGAKPLSLEEFATQPLPDLPINLSKQAECGAMYEHLRRYHTNLEKYRHLFGEPSPRRIPKSQIREYIAQDDPSGNRVHFNYLAVREAKIVCTFPNSDVGQIALIDMPGLGDTGLGDEERLIKTLGQDVDIVLFVRMPRPPREYWADVDVKLYDIASSALTELPIKLWSFLVLNRTDNNSLITDNSLYCQDLANTREEKHLYVVDHIIANCADVETVNQQILERILNYLASQMSALDAEYASSTQDRLIQLQKTVYSELEKAEKALERVTGRDNWFPLFVTLFDRLWEDLTTGLEALLRELREQRDVQDADFKQQVENTIKACREDAGIPTEAEINRKRDDVGGYPNAYYKYLNEVRSHLSQHFLSLDEGLKRGLDRIKYQVSQVLIERGHLGGLTESRGLEFLKTIAELIPEEIVENKPSELWRGFKILAYFELSYRGLIQHRIRQHLDDLTPDETSLQLSPSPNAQEVLNCLKSLQAEAVYKCERALDDLLAEPSQAGFAIVEEFMDRVLRAKEVKNEWRIFLEEIRHDVWPNEFEQLGERTRTRREWMDSVERATAANQLNLITFLN